MPDLDELRARRALERYAPDAAAVHTLPAAPPFSLVGVEVEVPRPEPLTEEALEEALFEALREVAGRRERGPGEAVVEGDELELEVLGTCAGRLIPFSARRGWRVELAPDPLLPGLFEALVSRRVGERLAVEVTLPPEYPVASLRGAPATFEVRLVRAFEVETLDPESPAVLARLGLGATLEEAVASLGDALREVRVEQAGLEYRERALDEVAARVPLEPPASAVELEIRQRWLEHEYPALVAWDLPPEALEAALEGWQRDPRTRLEAERRLKVAMGLQALIRPTGPRSTAADRREVLEETAAVLGVAPEELEALLAAQPTLSAQVERLAEHTAAVRSVLDQVTPLEAGPATPPPPTG